MRRIGREEQLQDLEATKEALRERETDRGQHTFIERITCSLQKNDQELYINEYLENMDEKKKKLGGIIKELVKHWYW